MTYVWTLHTLKNTYKYFKPNVGPTGLSGNCGSNILNYCNIYLQIFGNYAIVVNFIVNHQRNIICFEETYTY